MLFVFFSISLSSRIGASLAISLSLAFCFSLYICSFFNVASDEIVDFSYFILMIQ
jgi:hypothetical protein